MKTEDYKKIIQYLDVIQTELNKVASAVGHVSFEEFTARNEIKNLGLKNENRR